MQSYSKPRETYNNSYDFKTIFTGSLPDDTPLLNELGVDFSAIRQESTLVFDIFTNKERASTHASSDLIGPMVFVSLFAAALTLKAKLHFGYIYVLCMVCNAGIYGIVNLCNDVYIPLTTCCNITGYSFFPVMLFSWGNVFVFFLPIYIKLITGILFAAWGTYVATQVLSAKVGTYEKTIIMGYPIFVGYMCYIIMAVF